MIKLHHFGPNLGVADPSPFCLKVDAYLRMSGMEYCSRPGLGNLRKAPKGKLPFIEDDGKIIADSQIILRHLEAKRQTPMDAWLDKEQKAICHFISKSLEENLYFILVYFRWLDEDTWPKTREAFFKRLPWLARIFVPGIARKKTMKALYGQGISRHSKAEILEFAEQAFDALSDFLDNKKYAMGERLCSLDATLYAFLAEAILVDQDSEVNEMARRYPVLVKYCQRIHKQYYSQDDSKNTAKV